MENNEKAVIEDLESPKIDYRGVKAMPFIIGNETFEKLGTIGTSSNLTVYLTTVFNLNKVSAATLVNVFNGSTSFAAIFGAFLSDAYFGRYKTLGFACISSLMGMFCIMLTAAISKLHPPHCGTETIGTCIGPTPWQLGFLLVGFGFLVVGAGGIRPCNLAFGADQFNPGTESGKRGINSFFNWYYFTFTFAMMISLTAIVYVQSKNWSVGFAIPTSLMFLSCTLFFLGSRIYVKVRPQGSPVIGVFQVMVAAAKKRSLKIPQDPPQVSLFNYFLPNSINTRLPHTNQFRFLDKAAIRTPEDQVNPDGSAADPWRLCGMQQVEEAKCVMRVIPIWSACIIYYIPIVQMQTYAVFQALQSDKRLGHFNIPAGSYAVFSFLALTIWIPIYDRLLVPFLRRFTGKEGGITLLQRMGVGVILSVLSMLVAGLVEVRRRQIALTRPLAGSLDARGGAVSSLSAMWLAPQLTLTGLAEAFNSIGQIEFYYKQFPENMRSIAGSFFFLGIAISSYLSTFLISVVHRTTEKSATGNWLPEDLNKGRLEYFYYVIAVMGTLNFGYFLVCSHWYRYKGSYGSETGSLELEVINGTKEATEKHVV